MLDILLNHLGVGISYILLISMPIVLTAAGIGLVVGILQAVTQVQEQTIAAAPKILGVFMVILLGGGMIIGLIQDYFIDAVHIATQIIPKTDKFSQAPLNAPNNPYNDPYNVNNFAVKEAQKPVSEMKHARPDFKQLLSVPLNSPFLKKNKADKPDISSPAPALPNANISEEIQNYRNMKKSDTTTRSLPTLDQKTPVIPPLAGEDDEGSPLQNLDEPPAPNEISLKTNNTKLSLSPASGSTGAAAVITPTSRNEFDYNQKRSTIIVSSGDQLASGNAQTATKPVKRLSNRGAIILEAQ